MVCIVSAEIRRREPDRAGRPKMVLSAGPLDKSQHRVRGLP
jgi:hypothetical protein